MSRIGKSRDRKQVSGFLGLGGKEGFVKGTRFHAEVIKMYYTNCGDGCTTLRIY